MYDANLTALIWNVRGLNSLARREAVLNMLSVVRPNVVSLQETKLRNVDPSLAREFLGNSLSDFCYLPANGTRGGLLLAWDSEFVTITNPSLRNFSIMASVLLQSTNVAFLLTTVYGLPQTSFLGQVANSKASTRDALDDSL